MSPASKFFSLAALLLLDQTLAQSQYTCDDPTFDVCTVPDGATASAGITDYTTFNWVTLESVADAAILKRSLRRRQSNSEIAVCCNPEVYCLVLDDTIPFCYDDETTEFLLPDESYGFINNSTYYAADGTFVDYAHGYVSAADGSTETFAPASATGAALSSATAEVSVAAKASGTGGASGPLHTGENKAMNNAATATRSSGMANPTPEGAASRTSIAGGLSLAVALTAILLL